MSNYVNNIITCSKETAEKVLTRDRKYRDYFRVDFERAFDFSPESKDISIFDYVFEKKIRNLEDGRVMFSFSTRGMRYNYEDIYLIIGKFHDVEWWCIEENDVEQASFRWKDGEVEEKYRILFYQNRNDENVFSMDYSDDDDHYFLVKEFAMFKGKQELVLEDIYQNKTLSYRLSKEEYDRIIEKVRDMFTIADFDNPNYPEAFYRYINENSPDEESLWMYDVDVSHKLGESREILVDLTLKKDYDEYSDNMRGFRFVSEIKSFIEDVIRECECSDVSFFFEKSYYEDLR